MFYWSRNITDLVFTPTQTFYAQFFTKIYTPKGYSITFCNKYNNNLERNINNLLPLITQY